jgi:hypothetical protein
MPFPTHRYQKQPRMGLRYLADFMAVSKRGERSILQNSKYRPIAKVIQHTEARGIVGKFLRDSDTDASWLREEAERLRNRLADDDFDRELYDNNADYISRFADVCGDLDLPKAERLIPGPRQSIDIHGVAITVDLSFRLRRRTKTNKLRHGAAMLRYARGKNLPAEVGAWQSAFLLGFLGDTSTEPEIEPERQLCLTIDAYAGVCHPAPGNSVNRYHNMKAACQSIAEQWPKYQTTGRRNPRLVP